MRWSVLLFLLACTEKEDSEDTEETAETEEPENIAPTISISSHSNGVEVLDGYMEEFRATVSDDDHENSELSVAWYVDEELVP